VSNHDEEIMSTVRAAVRALILAAAVCAMGPRGQAAAEPNPATPWVELNNARARLVAGPPAAKAAKSYLAGVEITLGEGWKTYWRMPGDAGVPPMFDWTGSTNVASLKVLYPAPSRMSEPAAETIGYKKSVLFPVEVVPKDASRPVGLALAMEFGVCRDICIPAEAKFSLKLQPAVMAGAPLPAVLAALEKVPRQQAGRRAMDPRLKSATAKLEGDAPRLTIEANFPRGSDKADIFIEAPEGLYVPMPKRLPDARNGTADLTADAADGLVRFEVDLKGSAQDLKGKTLLLTLVSDAGATETAWTVP
jgi:DsbC/DsbD-like thiol-disulfide interchange protein